LIFTSSDLDGLKTYYHMKTLFLSGATIAILGLAPLSGQTQSTTTSSTTYLQTSKLVGTKVKSSQGEEIGVIKDVVLDRNTGCMAYTVISAGGTGTRVAGKTVAVPWTVYSPTSELSVLTVTVDRDRIYNAPVFDYARIDEYTTPNYINSVYSYYGVSAGAGVSGTTTTTTGVAGAAGAGVSQGASPAATLSPAASAPPAATGSPAATTPPAGRGSPTPRGTAAASPRATASPSTGSKGQRGKKGAAPAPSGDAEPESAPETRESPSMGDSASERTKAPRNREKQGRSEADTPPPERPEEQE
jgi:sporulation protein YlmC with PRC-barrel domain